MVSPKTQSLISVIRMWMLMLRSTPVLRWDSQGSRRWKMTKLGNVKSHTHDMAAVGTMTRKCQCHQSTPREQSKESEARLMRRVTCWFALVETVARIIADMCIDWRTTSGRYATFPADRSRPPYRVSFLRNISDYNKSIIFRLW